MDAESKARSMQALRDAKRCKKGVSQLIFGLKLDDALENTSKESKGGNQISPSTLSALEDATSKMEEAYRVDPDKVDNVVLLVEYVVLGLEATLNGANWERAQLGRAAKLMKAIRRLKQLLPNTMAPRPSLINLYGETAFGLHLEVFKCSSIYAQAAEVDGMTAVMLDPQAKEMKNAVARCSRSEFKDDPMFKMYSTSLSQCISNANDVLNDHGGLLQEEV
jgi:hypothetical protein